jgi:translation initiation factor 1 (eIF-1/SUI1)
MIRQSSHKKSVKNAGDLEKTQHFSSLAAAQPDFIELDSLMRDQSQWMNI